MNPFNLYEAYAAVYDEDLRDELEVIDEDLSFIDDLSDNELTQIMEEILRDGEVSLNECYYAFDEEVLTEARVTTGAGYGRDGVEPRKVRQGSAKVTYSKGEEERRARVGRKHAAKRLQVATGRAAERIRAGAESAKTKGANAISAMAGGAAEAGRKGKAAAQRVGGKLAAAKERISGFVKRVGRAAGAGYRAAKAEFSGQAAREAKARDTGRAMRRAARRQSRGAGPSPFDEPAERSTVRSGGGVGRREAASSGGIASRGGGAMGSESSSRGRALAGAPERKALPAAATPAPESARRKAAKAKIAKAVSGSVAKGTRFAAPGGTLASQRASTGKQEALARFRKKAGIAEEYLDMILDNILEEIIYEGYAADYDEALYVFEEIGMSDLGELAESYLAEEVETDDYYDLVLEHLLDEGYADTVEDATTIMANMSEEWRDEIIDEAQQIMSVSRGGKQIYKTPRSELHRPSNEPSSHEQKRMKQLKRARRNADRRGEESPARERAFDRFVSGTDTPLNRVRTSNIKKLNAPREFDYNDDPYRTVPTDYRARKRRASGR